MSDAENIVAFIRDIAIILFGIVGIVCFIIITVLAMKVAKQARLTIDRANDALSKVERILEVGNMVRDAVSNLVNSSNGRAGGGVSAISLFGPIAYVFRRIFRSGRGSKKESG